MIARARNQRSLPWAWVALAAAAAAGAALAHVAAARTGAASGQTAPVAAPADKDRIGGTERLMLLRAGTFEAWRDSARLGTEFYRVYANPYRDTLIAVSAVRYTLRNRAGTVNFEKWTLGISRALDSYPLSFRSDETIGARSRSLSVSTRDTTATIFREAEGGGEGRVIAVPPGRLYILDPSVYEQVESLVSEFFSRNLASRTQNVLMTPRDSVIEVRLTRGSRERIELPAGGAVEATRIDIFDDLTLIRTWVDESGLLLQLTAPAQGIRVVRLPPGEREAAAAAAAKGTPATPPSKVPHAH